jgi:hypothetical protein
MARFVYKDVTTSVRSSKAESILESMSEERSTKIASISKEIGSTYPVQQRPYSKNLDIVSPALISGNASIMIVGDSINNPTQANYMRIGYQNSWDPAYWKGISQGITSGNSSQNGAMITGGVGSGITGNGSLSNGPDPENSTVIGTPFSGTQVQPLGGTGTGVNSTNSEQTVAGSSSRAYTINGILSALDNWSGSQQSTHIFNGTQTAIRCLIYAEQDCTVIVDWKFGSGGNGPENNNQYSLTAGYNTIEKVVDNTGVSSNNGSTSLYLLGPTNTRIQLLACTYMDKAVTGMQMAYTGGGGFKTANHRYNYGHPSTELGNFNNRPFYYSDEAMKQYLDFMDTNIVMFHIGNNDGNVSGVVDNIEEVIRRYRRLKSGLKFLLIAPYPSNTDDTRWNAQVDFYENIAGSGGNEDVAFLNLTKKVKDSLGDYVDWKGTYLVDENTDVHPNLAGANKFAELEWEVIEDSYTEAGSSAAIFPTTIYGDDQYKRLMTSLKRVK